MDNAVFAGFAGMGSSCTCLTAVIAIYYRTGQFQSRTWNLLVALLIFSTLMVLPTMILEGV